MERKWIFASPSPDGAAKSLAKDINVPDVIAEILIRRGINTRDESVKFFRPKIERLYDPFVMLNMKTAVDRIQEALRNKEPVLIFGDYDVDGITSCSLLYTYLKQFTEHISYFIPDRLKDGYGFSKKGVEKAKSIRAKLIITVDCGITAIDEVKAANEAGIDVIITDHHQPGEQMPEAYAILNPMLPECPYPFKGLSGVGVAFKLAHAINMEIGWKNENLLPFTDLVAIGSSADIVPLVDENRILVKEGLDRINGKHNTGINALLDVANLNNCFIGTGQILFGIAPRINAVGRLGSAERAVKLFIEDDKRKAIEIANILESENKQRKSIEEIAFGEATEMAGNEFDEYSSDPLVLYKDGWHAGVVGIVASKLIDIYYRPTVMIAIEEGIGKGSVRSVPDFDVFEALKKCGDHLVEYGGHKYAAGLTISEDKIPAFKKAFQESVRDSITEDNLVPKLNIDGKITLDLITERFFKILSHFSPFGPQNSRPVFVAEGVEVINRPQIVGRNHLRFVVKQNGVTMPVIGFNHGDKLPEIENNARSISLAFVIEENTWQGNSYLQLQLKDVK